MARRPLTVLVAAPLVLAATECAHWAAFRVVTPDAHERAHRLAETGHGWLAHAAPLAALLALVCAVGTMLRVLASARGRAPGRLTLLPFAVAPPLAFALQEVAERLSHGDAAPAVLAEPVFWVGLAAQLPVALLAWALAFLVTRTADRVGAALARIAAPVARRGRAATIVWTDVVLPAVPALAAGRAGRAPPG